MNRRHFVVNLGMLLAFLTLLAGCAQTDADPTSPEPAVISPTTSSFERPSDTNPSLSNSPLASSPSALALSAPESETFQVYFIDVGQGDATLIVAANGETMLIDGGRSRSRIRERLETLGLTDLDAVLATHPDADHIAGLLEVFDLYEIERFYWNGFVHDTQTFSNLMSAAQAEGATIAIPGRGDTIPLGNLTFQVVHPDTLSGDSNVDSIVLQLRCGAVDILLTGDAEVPSEQEMLDSGLLVDLDVLKVGHHGSRTSTSDAFLAVVSPEVGVISAGLNSQFGHPHQEVVDRLTAAGTALWHTDITEQDDTVRLVSDCQTYQLQRASGGGLEVPSPTPANTPTPTPTPTVVNSAPPGSVLVTEIMPNPAAVSDFEGEWFEIYNSTSHLAVDINGWTIRDLGTNVHVIESPQRLIIPPRGMLVLGRNSDTGNNGGVAVHYQYSGVTLSNSGDAIQLVDPTGVIVDTVVYDSSLVFVGVAASLDSSSLTATGNDDSDNWCAAISFLPTGDRGTPGAENDPCQ